MLNLGCKASRSINRIAGSAFRAGVLLILAIVAQAADAQNRQITLASDHTLIQTGIWSYALPRFSLKTGISVELIALEADQVSALVNEGGADVIFVAGFEQAKTLAEQGSGSSWQGVISEGDPASEGAEAKQYAAVLVNPQGRPDDNREWAQKFVAWLVSDVGQRTLKSFRQDGVQVFFPIIFEETKEVNNQLTGNAAYGETLALKHCGRCHIVSEKNKFGGIDSTPSFAGLRTHTDWREKIEIFWTLNPHPSFTQIEGVTTPFHSSQPPVIAPIHLTVDEADNIIAYFATIEPRDLGPELQNN